MTIIRIKAKPFRPSLASARINSDEIVAHYFGITGSLLTTDVARLVVVA